MEHIDRHNIKLFVSYIESVKKLDKSDAVWYV